MNPREIPDIQEAEELLKEAERTFPSEHSASDFREAFQLLADYVETEQPDPKVKGFIENIKYSYTRTILSHLNSISPQRVDLFVHYLIVLFVTVEREFEILRVSYPDLGNAFDECRERFKSQIQDIISNSKGDA